MKNLGNLLLSVLMIVFAIYTANDHYTRSISLHENGTEKIGVVYSSVPKHGGSLKSANGTWRITIQDGSESIELINTFYIEPGSEVYYVEDPKIEENFVYGRKSVEWQEYIYRRNGGMGLIALGFIMFLGLCGIYNITWAVKALNKSRQRTASPPAA